MSKKQTENSAPVTPVKMPLPITSLKMAVICACIFFLIQLIGICHHSTWRDEFQAFQIAMNSHSITNLFFNMRQEGHGALWYLILYTITRFTYNIFAMQVVHIIIASASIFVLFRYAPFSLFEKVLISLGYFFFFEYAQVSREYSLGLFFIICICSVMGEKYYKRKSQGLPFTPSLFYIISLLLTLLSDTSLFGLIISIALASYFLLCIWDERTLIISNIKLKRALAFSVLILLTGWGFSILQMSPPADNSFLGPYHPTLQLSHTGNVLTQLMAAYFPFPTLESPFWNTYYILADRTIPLTAISLIVMVIIIFSFVKKPKLVLLYSISILGLVAFMLYSDILVASRFIGHSFLVLFICFWFERYVPSNQKLFRFIPDSIINGLRKSLFYLILTIQAVTGLFFYYLGLTEPFTNCTKAGEYVVQHHLDRFPVIGADDFVVCPLSYYTKKPIFTFNRNDTSRFVIWDIKRCTTITLKDVANMMVSQINKSPKDTCLLCMNVMIQCNNNLYAAFADCTIDSNHSLKFINKVDDPSMVPDDNYYFYYIWKKDKQQGF